MTNKLSHENKKIKLSKDTLEIIVIKYEKLVIFEYNSLEKYVLIFFIYILF